MFIDCECLKHLTKKLPFRCVLHSIVHLRKFGAEKTYIAFWQNFGDDFENTNRLIEK